MKQQSGKGVSALFPVERTLGPHSECACSRWGVGCRRCLLITWGPMSLSSILDAACYHLLGPVSLFSIFAKLCFGGESVARVVPYWLLFLLSLNVYFSSSLTASATENQAWVARVFTSSTGEAQAGKSV